MDMKKAKEVGAEIQRRLDEKNVNQSQAARAIGISPAAMSTYCTGTREASYETVCLICGYLGCTPNDLLGFPSQVNRELFRSIAVEVRSFLELHNRTLPEDRICDLCWSIYDTAVAEPELLIDANGKVLGAVLTGLMRGALSV